MSSPSQQYVVVPALPTERMIDAGFGRDPDDNSKHWLHPAAAYGLMLDAAPSVSPAMWLVIVPKGAPALASSEADAHRLVSTHHGACRLVPLYVTQPGDGTAVRAACFTDTGRTRAKFDPAVPVPSHHKVPEVVAHVDADALGTPGRLVVRFSEDPPAAGTALVSHSDAKSLARVADYWRDKYVALAAQLRSTVDPTSTADELPLAAVGTLCGADEALGTANVRFAHGLPDSFRTLGTKVQLSLVLEDEPVTAPQSNA